uniref:Uncharacterized protein n=1 Tax=viral metagenome TaxID=1070528 RepID=A0A6C0F5U0_9ZZZZ
MDTSLNTDTLHGVQPTSIGNYMINTSQIPNKSNCNSSGFYLQQPGFNCDVRHHKVSLIDSESSLIGLDRYITKQEPPESYFKKPQELKTYNDPPPKETYTSPFEPQGTRVGRSCSKLAGLNINRFENPLHEAQSYSNIAIDESFRGGFNTRLYAKDCQVVKCGKYIKLKPEYGNQCSN